MVENFRKSLVLLAYLSRLSHIIDWWHCSTLMEDSTWKIAWQYFNCLPKPMLLLLNLDGKNCTIKLFLKFLKTGKGDRFVT